MMSTELTYRLHRHVLIGPALRAIGRPRISGREHVPRTGPVIVAANHVAVLDSFYLALATRRRTSFLAKAEYFDGPGVLGSLRRRFLLSAGQIPVDRRGGPSATAALEAARRILADGGAWGIHPEGTRSPDGRMYRGRTGAVRIALETGTPIVPVALTGTRRGDRRRPVTVEFLPPLDLARYSHRPDAARAATDALMRVIAARTGQQYVDRYAREWSEGSAGSDA